MGPATTHAGSNGSSVGSGLDEKDSSYISSVDEYLLDNHASSSSIYSKEESERFIPPHHLLREALPDELLENISPAETASCKMDQTKQNENPTTDHDEDKSKATTNEIRAAKSTPLPNGMFRRVASVVDMEIESGQ